ncbi:MAG: hypothetical protein DRI95_07280 [Bacteroidetes bacterium]|nr:MAG: hypothetical protein DRI95_07280 [Bacteroidota bacterium]RLD75135.1 MAG: hypothetical protein DRJ07_18630 [Bacteroidota bacterium]
MKKTLAILLFVAVSFGTYAQSDNDYVEMMRSVLKTEKKAAIVEAMQLTDAESAPFWELYKEYNDKMYTAQNKRIKAIKDYADNYENLSDEKADEIWNLVLKFKQESAKLQKSYYKKFKKILPTAKAVRYFQVENKIEALIAANLALEIPLVETK